MRRGQKTGPQIWRQYKQQIDQDGYARTYAGRHPFKGTRLMIQEHVRVMESLIGRRLSTTECVHHKDGNRTNNSPDNLELMSRSSHSSLHAKENQHRRKRNHGRYA